MRETTLFTSVVLSLPVLTFGSEITEIKGVLERRLGQDQGSAAVGIMTRDGMNTFFHGDAGGDTMFELCSVTKVFTALLLADMTSGNELELHDPVNKLLRVRAKNTITISRKDGHLFSQATGRPKLEIVPIAETEFAVKGFNIKITFIKDKAGQVTSLIVHQTGKEVKARKQP